MKSTRTRISHIFLHLDGAVLENILAPVILSLVRKLGGSYSAELENNILSRSQSHAATFLISHLNLQLSVEEVIELYKKERKAYILTNQIRQKKGVRRFLTMLKKNGYRILAYGGADRDYFLTKTKNIRSYFDGDGYIHTRDIRPGVKEIVRDICRIGFHEALFIDDTTAVAGAAREHDVPFIGISTGYNFSFQQKEMGTIGVKYFVKSLSEIDLSLLTIIQEAALCNRVWK
jgi:phosphoglycolate phosphatase-like HAD superfamily hydrolase